MKLYSKYIKTSFLSNYHLARLTAGFFVSICLLPLFSCSENEDGGGEPKELTVSVEAGSMPTGGRLTAQYEDFVSGAGLENVADGNERTTYSTSHKTFYLRSESRQSIIINRYVLVSS